MRGSLSCVGLREVVASQRKRLTVLTSTLQVESYNLRPERLPSERSQISPVEQWQTKPKTVKKSSSRGAARRLSDIIATYGRASCQESPRSKRTSPIGDVPGVDERPLN